MRKVKKPKPGDVAFIRMDDFPFLFAAVISDVSTGCGVGIVGGPRTCNYYTPEFCLTKEDAVIVEAKLTELKIRRDTAIRTTNRVMQDLRRKSVVGQLDEGANEYDAQA
jgi:hypothetical protein